MTKDDIIRMAREAGVSIRGHYDETGSTTQELERFAALVAAAERERAAIPNAEEFVVVPKDEISHCGLCGVDTLRAAAKESK